jgi:hypothetical protein
MMKHSPAPVRIDIVVTTRPAGSLEHYFHFLLGLLAPLVVAWNDLASTPNLGRVVVRSCAIFDRLLLELDLQALDIVSKAQHAALLEGPVGGDAGRPVRVTALTARDAPEAFDRSVFNQARERLLSRLSQPLADQLVALAPAFSPSGARIVFIDRDAPDPFYGSDRAEIPTAGAQRRSIANFRDAHAALAARFGNVLATTLEGRSLAYQIALFQAADIVVCQHGAALANLIWAREGSSVIEIVPRHAAWSPRNRRFRLFERLAACLSIRHRKLTQPSAHGAIDIGKLCELVAAAQRDRGQPFK